MKVWQRVRFLVISLTLMCTGAQMSLAAADEGLRDRTEMEAAIDAAREELDAAAARLAQLHREMFEQTGEGASRPMLGLLLGESAGQEGVQIVGVTPGGGAERAGLAAGDRLLAIDGHRFDTGGNFSDRFNQALDGLDPGAVVNVEYARDGSILQTAVTTQARQNLTMRVLHGDVDWLPDQRELELEIETAVAAGQAAASEAMTELRAAWPMIHSALQPSGLRLEAVSGDLARYFQVDEGVLVLAAGGPGSGPQAIFIHKEVSGPGAESTGTATIVGPR